MTTVYYTLTDAGGRPLQRQTVKISAVAPGNPHTTLSSAVIHTRTVDTDTDGRFDVELIPTSQYEYEGTVYRVDARDGLSNDDAVWWITVPDTGTHDLRDLLVADPGVGEPVPPVTAHRLRDHIDVSDVSATDGQILTWDTAEAHAEWRTGSGGGVTDHGALTGLTDPDHPIAAVIGLQAALDGKEDDGTAAAAVAAHVAAADPHPQYLTPAEGSAAYDALGAATAAVAAHEAETDPHPQYQDDLTARGVQELVAADAPALRRWFAALNARDSARATVMVIGDSHVEGEGATDVDRRFASRLRQQLRWAYPTVGAPGGAGFLPPAEAGSASMAASWPVDTSASLPTRPEFGPTRNAGELSNGTHFIEWDVSGTSFDLMYFYAWAATQGVLRYIVDGGTPVSIDTGDHFTLEDGVIAHVEFAARGAHTVRVEWVSGPSVIVDGLVVYDGDEASGLTVHALGRYGYATGDWAAGGLGIADWAYPNTWKRLDPDLVVIALGTNDLGYGATPAAMRTNIEAIIARIRTVMTTDPSIALVVEPSRGDGTFDPADWAPYVTELWALADADGDVAVFDATLRLPPGDAASPYYTDDVHMSDDGHGVLALTLGNAITGHALVGGEIEAGLTEAQADDLYAPLAHDLHDVYPIQEGYGYHSASVRPEQCRESSGFQAWITRVWVPAGKTITKVGYFVTFAGTLGAGGFNSWGIYDDAGTLIGETPTDDAMWTGAQGWREKTLTAPVAAQTAGRFVRVRSNVAGITDLQIAFAQAQGGEAFSPINGPGTRRRSVYTSNVASWPATFDPSAVGTTINYLPLVTIG